MSGRERVDAPSEHISSVEWVADTGRPPHDLNFMSAVGQKGAELRHPKPWVPSTVKGRSSETRDNSAEVPIYGTFLNAIDSLGNENNIGTSTFPRRSVDGFCQPADIYCRVAPTP